MAPVGDNEPNPTAGKRARWWSFGGNFAWSASLFLTGLGAKLGLILFHGLAFPYWDQWPGEAEETFARYFAGWPLVKLLFAPHNEHRIVFTRAAELFLLKLNGQWDSLLELTVSAVFFCAGITGFGWLMASLLGKRAWPLIWVVLVLDLALPFAWENTLWAFQSQFYFLIIFSLATIWLLGLSRPWSWRWWLGIAAAAAAFFSMASGFVAAAVAGAVTALAVAREPRGWRRQVPTWVVCAAIVGAGLVFRINVPGHEHAEAQSAGEFLFSFGKQLSWPWAVWAWYAPINLAPLATLAWLRVRSAEPAKRAELLIFGIAGWVMLQALAAAFMRGIGGGAPAWRYMDHLSFLAITNCFSIYLLTQTSWWKRHSLWFYGGTVVWAIGCISGLCFLTWQVHHRFIPEIEAEQAVRLASARAFVATDDPGVFVNEPVTNRPVPSATADVWLFRTPALRAILPVCVREPLHLVPATNADATFIRNGWLMTEADAPTERSWGSYSAKKEAARGTFESQPIAFGGDSRSNSPRSVRLPYLDIPVAGDLGGPGLSLELVELATGKVTKVSPPYMPGGAWLNVHVSAPAGPFKIVARDDSDTGWFAFKEPIEMGRLSRWTLAVLAGWQYCIILGAGGFLMNFARWWREPQTKPGAI